MTLPFGEFLASLVQALRAEGVCPCVLRNYEQFPNNNIGHDIDFLILPSESAAAIHALRSVQGIRIVGYSVRPSVAITFSEGISSTPELRALQVDFNMSLNWKGLPFLPVEMVLEAAIPREAGSLRFFVPSPVHEAIISLLSSLLVGGWLKEKYFPQVQLTFANDRSEVIEALSFKFGLKAATQLVDSVIRGDRNKILGCVPLLRASLGLQSLLYRPIHSALAIIHHYTSEFEFRFSPKTLETVRIVGPNGYSQATIIEALIPMLQSTAKMVKRTHSTQQSPSTSKPKRIDVSKELCTEKSGNMFALIARIVLWLVHEWLSQFTEKKNLTLRICESCYYDILIDDKKRRLSRLPDWLAQTISRMLPPADLWIWLCPALEGMQAKGREVPPAEKLTQLKDYGAFLKTKRKHIIIDTSKPEASVIDEVYAAIINTLAQRTDRQLALLLTPKE